MLGCVGFIGGDGLWQEPNPKRACPFGYKELRKIFLKLRNILKKRLDAIMLKIMLEYLGLIFVKEWI